MADQLILRFYLPKPLRASAEAGQHNFISKVVEVAQSQGFTTEFLDDSEKERRKASSRDGYALFHMHPPTHDRALSFRRAYYYPFWKIEDTNERWNYRVARTKFLADKQDPQRSETFAKRLRRRVFDVTDLGEVTKGLIYMPLQGKLLRHRSFQSCSPLEMIEQTLEAMPNHQVVATLHPNEIYTEAEFQALHDLEDRHDRFSIGDDPELSYLQACEYIVTQNSGAAFNGLLFHKPCLLFARIDFHHICAPAYEIGTKTAFEMLQEIQPDYDRYLFWFLQKMSINAGSDAAQDKILNTFRHFGWDL